VSFTELVLSRVSNIKGNAALFVDRDGVINVDTGYVSRPEDIKLIGGVAQAIFMFNTKKIPVICITNQSGIARGYYGWGEFINIHSRIDALLAEAGAHIDAIFASGNGPGDEERPGSWRKPSPGMFFAARQLLGIDLSKSVVVGDKVSDIVAGERAGLKLGALVASEFTESPGIQTLRQSNQRLMFGSSFADIKSLVMNAILEDA
jgi:D-glycero-D-manno-heptose 1,7-bisphosphate phosphatase